MKSSINQFKNAISKAYTTQPNVKLNKDTMSDANKYMSSFKESMDDDDEFEIKKKHISNKLAKNKFSDDLKDDMDFIDFKTRNKFKDGPVEYTFGTPHAVHNDPFVNKKLKKKETKEATSSGSSGAFVAPVGFKNSEFVRRSFAETPKLKESEVEKVEAAEATTSGSVGGYSSPAMWAKSTSKKDWGPSRKTQYPGGGFVKIKKKCTKFPYCNQGDINNLKISKNESVKEAIDNVAKKFGLSKDVIMTILEHEYEITSKRIK
jgi:hypothetical protein